MNAPRPERPESSKHREARDAVWSALPSWRRFIIAIDGRDGSGKSSIAQYLAWQLGMPAVELDTFLDRSCDRLALRDEELLRVLNSRLESDRPVIVEGVFVLRVLHRLSLKPDFLIIMEQRGHTGSISLADEFEDYETEYTPKEHCQFEFIWDNAD